MSCSIIVAMARNRVIGLDGDLPWRLPADLKRFKRLTMGHHLIMGRSTWESIGIALPGRTSIVLSRRDQLELPEGVLHSRSFSEALDLASGDPEPFVIGGATVYAEALAATSKVYLTRVHAVVDGDTFFPECSLADWRLEKRRFRSADRRHPYPISFLDFSRR